MRIDFSTGKRGLFYDSSEAIDFLKQFEVKNITTQPERLTVRSEGNSLYLVIFDGMIREYKIRRSFLEKLLKWYSFPVRQLEFFDIDTITSICNDYIINIKAKHVNIKIEDNEALTITSDHFTEVSDVELINRLDKLNIETIYIDDFSTKVRINERYRIKPFKGDEFGIGMLVTNSETGFSAVKIHDFLLRYVCSNGAYVAEDQNNVKFFHYNLFVQDVFDRIETMIENIDARGNKIEERIRQMNTLATKENIISLNKEIMRATAIKMLNDVIDSDRMPTKYELFNIITERAKEFQFGLRTRIETIAGSLIQL